MNPRKSVYRVCVLVLASAVIFGCAGAGAGSDGSGGWDGESFEIRAFPFGALIGIAGSRDPALPESVSEAILEMASSASAGITFVQLYVTLAYSGWDESFPPDYESGGVDYSWERIGDTLRWTFTYGSESIVIEVTDLGSSRDVLVKKNDETLLSGNVANGGGSGSASFYPDWADPGEYFLAVWEPSVAPFDILYTVTKYSGVTAEALLTVNTDFEGESGQWSYEVPPGTLAASGEWPEP